MAPQPNHLLRQARELRGWSQSHVAEHIQAPVASYISRWERGITIPSPYYREKLCRLFDKNAEELGLIGPLDEHPLVNIPHVPFSKEQAAGNTDEVPVSRWYVPHSRKPFFTGREDTLQDIHTRLNPDHSDAAPMPIALCGLAGIGKTQVAIEYAYRYRKEYSTVLWLQFTSIELPMTEIITITQYLNLAEKNAPNFDTVIAALKHWLETNIDWLLIFDNIETLETISNLLPSIGYGHIILTTRTQATGPLAYNLSLEQLTVDEGALLLLRRAKQLAPGQSLTETNIQNRNLASELVRWMDGLPLALDQAGAYIEENACGISNYMQLYQQYHVELLQRRGRYNADHSDSVTMALLLCLEKVQQKNPIAADLLSFCAFIAPNAIPEDLITKGAAKVCPPLSTLASHPLQLYEAFSDLLTYSLLHREAEKQTFRIHCLTQSIFRHILHQEEQQKWANWAVQAVNCLFPDTSVSTWGECQRYLTQAISCATLIDTYHITNIEAARLLHQAGHYLCDRAQYLLAENFLQRALTLYQQLPNPSHIQAVACLHTLGTLYTLLHQEEQAEAIFERVLQARMHLLGANHLLVAESYNELASLCYYQGKYSQAEHMYLQAIAIWEQASHSESPDLATGLNNLARLYQKLQKYERVEPLLQRAITIWHQALGDEHPNLAFAFNNLAQFYQYQHRYEQAEKLFTQALELRQKAMGKEHPRVAASLANLAQLYAVWGKKEKAIDFYKQSIAIQQATLGPHHAGMEESLSSLKALDAQQ